MNVNVDYYLTNSFQKFKQQCGKYERFYQLYIDKYANATTFWLKRKQKYVFNKLQILKRKMSEASVNEYLVSNTFCSLTNSVKMISQYLSSNAYENVKRNEKEIRIIVNDCCWNQHNYMFLPDLSSKLIDNNFLNLLKEFDDLTYIVNQIKFYAQFDEKSQNKLKSYFKFMLLRPTYIVELVFINQNKTEKFCCLKLGMGVDYNQQIYDDITSYIN